MLNSFNLSGRIGKVEVKKTSNNKEYTQLRIAIPEYIKKTDETTQEVTNWVSVRVFGRDKLRATLDNMKGEQIAVSGKLRTYQIQVKGEQYPRNQMYVMADQVSLFGSNKSTESNQTKELEEIPF